MASVVAPSSWKSKHDAMCCLQVSLRQPSEWTSFRTRYCVNEKRSAGKGGGGVRERGRGVGWGKPFGCLAHLTFGSDFLHFFFFFFAWENCPHRPWKRRIVFAVSSGCQGGIHFNLRSPGLLTVNWLEGLPSFQNQPGVKPFLQNSNLSVTGTRRRLYLRGAGAPKQHW